MWSRPFNAEGAELVACCAARYEGMSFLFPLICYELAQTGTEGQSTPKSRSVETHSWSRATPPLLQYLPARVWRGERFRELALLVAAKLLDIYSLRPALGHKQRPMNR